MNTLYIQKQPHRIQTCRQIEWRVVLQMFPTWCRDCGSHWEATLEQTFVGGLLKVKVKGNNSPPPYMIAGDKEEGCFPFFAVAKLSHAPSGLNKPFIYPLATLFGAVHTHFPFPVAPHRSFIELGFPFGKGRHGNQ
jgi:hypothetical protein